jgi:aminomethyltransferase
MPGAGARPPVEDLLSPSNPAPPQILRTPLYELHASQGAKFVAFAGYDMPVQFGAGIIAEHKHVRAMAGLFDVSHMGQIELRGADAATALEALTPGDFTGLGDGAMRYTLFTNDAGGVLDDLMVTRFGEALHLVVNAATKAADLAHLAAILPPSVEVRELEARALLAFQGPKAAAVLERLAPGVGALRFMQATRLSIGGIEATASRSGYTGEDGFEVSVAAGEAAALARLLLAEPEVAPIGLGARDSLRLEAGLCLYGSDLAPDITPVEAGLRWTIAKRRRTEGGYPGAEVIARQLSDGPPRRRVGLRPSGRAIARAHTAITGSNGEALGEVTSGGFGPSVDGAIAMGYVRTGAHAVGQAVSLSVRNRNVEASIVTLPFTPHRYVRQ